MLTTNHIFDTQGFFFNRFFDTVGDGSGTKNAIGDYSLMPQDFILTPNPERSLNVGRIIIEIVDGGSLDAGRYGNGIVLTNGIFLLLVDADLTTERNYMENMPVLTNGDWARFTGNIIISTFGAGDNFLTAVWDLTTSGKPVTLNNQSLVMRLNDDFSNLVSHTFVAQGIAYDGILS